MLSKNNNKLDISEDLLNTLIENDDNNYNKQILIYGEVGKIKTQLMNTIYQLLKKQNSKSNIKLISANKFSKSLIEAHECHSLENYIERFYELDGLILQDLEDYDESPRTQKELYHLIKHFKKLNKFLVISHGIQLSDLENLEVKCRALLGFFNIYRL